MLITYRLQSWETLDDNTVQYHISVEPKSFRCFKTEGGCIVPIDFDQLNREVADYFNEHVASGSIVATPKRVASKIEAILGYDLI